MQYIIVQLYLSKKIHISIHLYKAVKSKLLTQAQIILIKKSWRLLRNIDPQIVGDTFYSKLFSDNRSLRKMFPTNMEQQYKKLIDMLSAIVMRLDNLADLTDDIAAMAQRHIQYGVKPLHYTLVGTALLWTLQQGLGKDWTKETEEAWTNCYTILANTMINASNIEFVTK